MDIKAWPNMAVFVDLTKAFDTVSRTILLRKMELYGIAVRTSLEWFTSYLSDKQQKCVVEGSLSASKNHNMWRTSRFHFRTIVISFIY